MNVSTLKYYSEVFISGDGFYCYHTSDILALPTVLYDG